MAGSEAARCEPSRPLVILIDKETIMDRLLPSLFLILFSVTGLIAQEGVDVNPPTDPSAPVTESPTLWIILAIVLLAGLFLLRRRAKPRRS